MGSRSDCVATVASTDAAFSAHRCRVDMRVACDDLGCAVASSLPFSDPIAARSNDLGSHFFSEPISPARTPRSPTSRDQTCESSPTPPPTMAGMARNTRQVCWQQCSISQWSLDTTRPPPTPSLSRPWPRKKAREAFGIARDAMKRSTELNL